LPSPTNPMRDMFLSRSFYLRMILSENRFTLFGIMRF